MKFWIKEDYQRQYMVDDIITQKKVIDIFFKQNTNITLIILHDPSKKANGVRILQTYNKSNSQE